MKKRAAPPVSPPAATPAAASHSAAQSAPQQAPAETEDDLFAIHPELAAAEIEPPPIAAGRTCARCRRALPIGSVLCVNCGFDTRTGHAVAVTQIKPSIALGGSGGGKAWPIAIGAISIVFGAGGTLVNGLGLLNAITEMASATITTQSIGALGGASFAAFMSVWLLSAGIGIVRRRESGVTAIRRWAITKMVLSATCLSCAGIALIAGMSAAASSMPKELSAVGPGLVAAILVAALAWFLAWPVFVLAWFARDAVKEDVKRWM
jgi:hypothetical protein